MVWLWSIQNHYLVRPSLACRVDVALCAPTTIYTYIQCTGANQVLFFLGCVCSTEDSPQFPLRPRRQLDCLCLGCGSHGPPRWRSMEPHPSSSVPCGIRAQARSIHLSNAQLAFTVYEQLAFTVYLRHLHTRIFLKYYFVNKSQVLNDAAIKAFQKR
jgi:hypothetical protein